MPVKKQSAPLASYRSRRDFSRTSEPRGEKLTHEQKNRFVVHKHAARSLHYDLRLEMHGVLRCWAVPKGPPLRSGVRRLAIPTEDHPVEYIDFVGTIPAGEYGAGTVEIWDHGTYELDPRSDLHKELKLFFHGSKLRGSYVLVKTLLGDGTAWLFMKMKKS